MRILFHFAVFLLSTCCYSQPINCDDREVYASLQVIHSDCDSTVIEAFPNGSTTLQWYVNGMAVTGENRRIFRYPGSADAFLIGVQVTDDRYCNFTEYSIRIEGGCPVEDCANGIDDDGNGLVDLNDHEACNCSEPPEVMGQNLFPNPGFEDRRDLPECQGCYSAGQAFPCVTGWMPGNSITTLEHVLRCFATRIPSRFTPYATMGSNFSIVGGFAAYDTFDFTAQESAVVALTEPTIPGERYRLIFQTDIVNGSIFDLRARVQGDISQYLSWYTSPVTDSFPYRYNIVSGEVSFGGNWDNWTVLDSIAIAIDDDLRFEQFIIEFTAPPQPIRAMAFASARNQLRRRQLTDIFGDYEIYWVLDNVQLHRIRPPIVLAEDIDATISTSTVVDNGSPDACATALLLSVPSAAGNRYQWYREGVALPGATQSTFQIPAAAAEGSLYQVRITNSEACKTSDPVLAQIPAPFEVTFTVDSLRCGGASDGRIALEVMPTDADFIASWSNAMGENLGNTSQIQALSSGRYHLNITDRFGCSYPYSFDLTAPPTLSTQLTANNLDCNSPDGQAALNLTVSGGTPPYTYYYDSEATPASLPLRRPPGNYQIRVIDAIGCQTETAMVTISDTNPFSLEISSSVSDLSLGESTTVRTNSNRDLTDAVIQWTPTEWVSCQDCLRPTLRPTESGTLSVLVTDIDGCRRSDSIAIRVIPTRRVYFPSAISPNGDGVNDAFRGYPGSSVERIISLEIYDRWGSIVFSQDSGNPAWAPSAATAEGVFVYQAEVLYIDGSTQKYSGAVTLIR